MKHLKLFQTEAEYNSATLELPNVSYVVETNSIEFNPYVIEKNIIHFVLSGENCEAEEGMTFKEWIFSDYFDINNPYNLHDGHLGNVRDYITEYGSENLKLVTAAGYAFDPDICIKDVIIANMIYSINNVGHGGQ